MRYLKNNVLNFKKQVITFFRNLPGGGLLGLLGSALISIPILGPFLAKKLGIGKDIAKAADDIPVPKNRTLMNKILGNDTILKKGVKSGLRDAFNFLVPVDLAIESIFGIFDFMDRKKRGQDNVQAGAGVGGEIIGGITGAAIALTVFPEPFSSVAGTLTLLTLPFLTRMLGGKVADDITGVNRAIGGQSSGWTWVGENGPELLNLPLNSHVVANHQLNRLKGPGRRVVTEVVNLPTEYRTTPVKATSNTPATKIQVINPINVGNRHMVEVPREFGFSGILQLQG